MVGKGVAGRVVAVSTEHPSDSLHWNPCFPPHGARLSPQDANPG